MKRWLIAGIILTLLVGGGAYVWHVGMLSLEAEEGLQRTLHSIRLVDQFVQKNGRWPRAWKELEGVKIPEGVASTTYFRATYTIADLEQFVWIDFEADPNDLADRSVETFTAVRPKGIHYPYKWYGFIDDLLRTLRDKGFGEKKR